MRFSTATVLFHLALLVVCGLILRRWWRRAASESALRLGARALGDGGLFLGAAVLWAAVCTLVGPLSGFTTLRFMSQALFAEGVLLAAAIAGVLCVHRRRGLAAAGGVLAVGLLAVYVDAYHLEPKQLQVRTHTLDLAHSPAQGTLRLLHISDIQADRITDREESVVSLARELAPDLILLTGDYIQPRLGASRGQVRTAMQALLRRSPLRAPLGVFAVRGDVDVDWPQVLEGSGASLLSGTTARVALPGGRSLTLLGLTPGMSRGQDVAGLQALLAAAPAEDLRIALGHNPDFVIPVAGANLVDLAVAGHTHGGQVRLPIFGAPYTKSRLPRLFASGLHEYGGIPLHVSAGVGMERGTAPQIRFLCPPEICLLEITY